MDEPFHMPRPAGVPDEDGWIEETLEYRSSARPKSTFKTVLDARTLFGDGRTTRVRTRTREPREGRPVLELHVEHDLGGQHLSETLECVARDGLRASRLVRTLGETRKEEVDFERGPFALPRAAYPDVLIPFLLRWQPRDSKRRAAYAWTADRFIARVYYETRHTGPVSVPAGTFEAAEVWMYPDLNDWIPLGSLVTRLSKPFLPRYTMWFEVAPPYRVLRFEGAYGPPGAPEVVLQLCR